MIGYASGTKTGRKSSPLTAEAVAPASGWIGVAVGNYAESGGIDAAFTNLRITKL